MWIVVLSICIGVALGIWVACPHDDTPKRPVEKPKSPRERWREQIAGVCPICDGANDSDHSYCAECSARHFAKDEGILKNPYSGEILSHWQWENVEIILVTHTGDEAYQLVLGLFQPLSSTMRQRADAFVERHKRRTYAEISHSVGKCEERADARRRTTVYVKQRLAREFPETCA